MSAFGGKADMAECYRAAERPSDCQATGERIHYPLVGNNERQRNANASLIVSAWL
jgi:hypothetical protein